MRSRKVRISCSLTNSNSILQPQPQLQPKHQIAAQTLIRCRLPVCSPNANLHTKCIFAAQTHFSCPSICIPEVLLRNDCRTCCHGSMRCANLKSPKGLLAGTQSSCDPANTAGPTLGEACDARDRKVRRAG